MSSPTVLRGMTWSHTRGYVPLVATAQRYTELHPDVEIVWEKRSLKAFEELPIQQLAARCDLVVIDHPFVGEAVRDHVFLPLDELLPEEFLANQAAHAVGASHLSYQWANHAWALAIDAATPVAAWRPDLVERERIRVPTTYEEVIALGRRGALEIPAAPINCLMDFYGLCLAAGEEPFVDENTVVSYDAGARALQWLRELIQLCAPDCLSRNPIQSLDRLSSATNEALLYCLFPYGYSNYAQDGYAAFPLVFGDVPTLDGKPMRTTLGGTGLAISAQTKHRTQAAAYAQFVASQEVQTTLYARSGGQPGHRSAWTNTENNRRSRNYFSSTLPTLDRAYVRPRYAGYLHGFQEPAGEAVQRYVRSGATEKETLNELNRLYVSSRAPLRSAPHHASA